MLVGGEQLSENSCAFGCVCVWVGMCVGVWGGRSRASVCHVDGMRGCMCERDWETLTFACTISAPSTMSNMAARDCLVGVDATLNGLGWIGCIGVVDVWCCWCCGCLVSNQWRTTRGWYEGGTRVVRPSHAPTMVMPHWILKGRCRSGTDPSTEWCVRTWHGMRRSGGSASS